MMPLFVSFSGKIKGQSAVGWCVLKNFGPISNGEDVLFLARYIEKERGYDPETIVLNNFQRLEAEAEVAAK